MGVWKAERLGGLQVHDHLEFCRKLHREIARLFTAQDAIDIGGGATIQVYRVDSVGEQTAVSGKVRCRIDRRYVVSCRREVITWRHGGVAVRGARSRATACGASACS